MTHVLELAKIVYGHLRCRYLRTSRSLNADCLQPYSLHLRSRLMIPSENHLLLREDLYLREIRPEDHARHRALMQHIYPQAFAYLWPDEGAWYVNHVHRQEALLADLATPDAPYYHVYFRDQLIGILRLKRHVGCPDFPGRPALKLERMYLDDAARGHGIGKALVAFARREARRLHKTILWLERMDSNDATISFYRSAGFTDGGSFTLDMPLMYEQRRGMVRMWLEV